jgi:hypothetical protein
MANLITSISHDADYGHLFLEILAGNTIFPFICLCAVGIVTILVWFPDTRRVPLEEVAKLFGVSITRHEREKIYSDIFSKDEEMVAVYQRDLTRDGAIDDKMIDIAVHEMERTEEQV